jgi:hypothetical protein
MCCNRNVHVPAAGPAPTGLNPVIALQPLRPTNVPLEPAPADDLAVGLLFELALPAIHAAIQLPDNRALADSLILGASQAVASGDVPRALHAVTELLTRHPDADLRALQEPALASIRGDIREIVSRLAGEAKIDARNTLAIAAPLAGGYGMPHEAPAVIALANQFIETGQYVNYFRAGELGRLVISWSQSETEAQDHAEQNVAHAVRRIAVIWRRAPLLVLLGVWLLLGIVLIRFATELWATGFLALVAIQFVVTVRNWPRRR